VFSIMSRQVFRGIGASKGLGSGKCLLLGVDESQGGKATRTLKLSGFSSPEEEIALLESAIVHVEEELHQIRDRVESDAGKDASGIFDAQLLMLRDPLFIDDVKKRIRAKLIAAQLAVAQSVAYLQEKFSTLSGEYMRERGEDIRDVGMRVIEVLRGKHEDLDTLREQAQRRGDRIVLVSSSLAAATIAHFGRKLLGGIVAETGSRTSHLAIVARSLKIPAVLGVERIVQKLKGGEVILVDGNEGQVIVNPLEDEVVKAQKETDSAVVEVTSGWEATATLDGRRVQVFANVADLEGVEEASLSGAEGIGLFRTEFLYFNRDSLPSEDELYQVMKKTLELMKGRTVIVRTLDIGGDKKPSYIEFPTEKNPALGLRGIRFTLKNPSLFETQIAAILRATTYGDIWIMFPMISTVKELREAKKIVEQAKARLGKKNITINAGIKTGIMVETPSAALLTKQLATEADFLSLGTNDLVQYAFATDRENENVASGDPLEPSVLRLIQMTIQEGHLMKRHVGMCGEMAADSDAVPILVGLGLDEFSVDPSRVQAVKKEIQFLRFSEASKAASEALLMDSAIEVRKYSQKTFRTKLS
jgi:phosphotransferase system enzyme I (PtsI)